MQIQQSHVPQGSASLTRKPKMSPEESQQLKNWLTDIAVDRDRQAFAQIFKWFAPKIIRFGIKQLGSEAAANELLQDTMSNVWRKSHLFDFDKGAATTWIYTIMRNVSFDMLRKIRSQREDYLSDDMWPIVEAQNVQEVEFADHLMQSHIAQYIELLPQAQQQVIRGVYFQELSQEQLAEQLNIPLGTVKSRLRLALNKLKEQLGEL
ncbi:sigma-70 family RNA polymerase sigma factor [Pseudoalteromonas tunicata]|jgi:RNA polymerase sigma-70 factor (ECF subfamily)|uniref:RNA polymerase sigma-70 factor n=1 Tax=Pseudoalteromonas tunicata D2 TaxID=87626 RepID=A4C4A3_9GAMM|nr:sigma-70 family RNA polymerase sigma factor [Pseudoalteromonas tunicata]ATC97133.1 RNA polymerase sigma-70 factor, ECF subfamily [Pseudoalteromonas tunicata]AXT33240.1 sigma-70 family RNA polymerase sigma factor [Pseudoalteromonas tunicata]EAR30385.1 RNA polymerase sigma-70 factor [Pseudoalteromonas tunicata D2]MDP4984784.1 sigma-70 family RNA polymerase sigma factor [Pseudoalteromonas tunicata]MDP5214169.1 sigma-70 family RNA polymerase sigma factor [Pseudoalteromonas tunicata]